MTNSRGRPGRNVSELGAGRSQRIRLCVLDVDGTLLTSQHEVTGTTRDAVARARAKGLKVMLASSRGPTELQPVLMSLHTPPLDVFIASQGAVTARLGAAGSLEVIAQHPSPLQAARKLVNMALASGISVNWYSGAHWYVPQVDSNVEAEARIVGHFPTVTDLNTLDVGPDKLLLISPTKDSATLQTLAEELPVGLQAQVSKPTYLEVTSRGIDKASAVRRHCQAVGFEAAEVLAVGDGLNDCTLFAFAGVSVATANATPEVRAAADFVTLSNDEDGVALALELIVP
jgi:Cof subfamily protein (haloacid dehalogenase superfamily)